METKTPGYVYILTNPSRVGGLGIKVRNKNEVETRILKKTCIFRMKNPLFLLAFPKDKV